MGIYDDHDYEGDCWCGNLHNRHTPTCAICLMKPPNDGRSHGLMGEVWVCSMKCHLVWVKARKAKKSMGAGLGGNASSKASGVGSGPDDQ